MNWNIDPSHTSLEFAVRHMMFATVRGKLRVVGGSVQTDDQGAPTAFQANIATDSIHTADEQRDGHLKAPDFLDVAQFPEMTFKSTSITANGGNNFTAHGDLSMRGVTKPVALAIQVSGTGKDPWGNTRISAEATGQLSRKEWGLTWNQALEAGGVLVGDEVKFTIDAQAIAGA